MPVHGVVGRLGDPPRNLALRRVVLLPAHRHPAGVVEERARVAPHDEQRHQVLEHRAAPRQQDRRARRRREQATERKPAFLPDLALRDGNEDAQPRFGSEQVVVAGVGTSFVDVESDRHQVPRVVVQEAVLGAGQCAGACREFFELVQQRTVVCGGRELARSRHSRRLQLRRPLQRHRPQDVAAGPALLQQQARPDGALVFDATSRVASVSGKTEGSDDRFGAGCKRVQHRLPVGHRHGRAIPVRQQQLHRGCFSLGGRPAKRGAAFAVAQIPLGMLLDRLGGRRVEGILLVAAAAGSAAFAAGRNLGELAGARALIGLARAVLGKSTWAVLALTLHIELFTQAHYRASIAAEADICELWRDVFLFHWKEESQHAVLDELEATVDFCGVVAARNAWQADNSWLAELRTRALERKGVPSRSHRPSRSLREEPATLCLLTFARLAHPDWKMACSHYDVRTALMQAIEGLDLVRADLLARIAYRPAKASEGFGSFDFIRPEKQERISFALGERFERLRTWLNAYRAAPPQELDVFLSRLFGELLSQPGYGFHTNFDAAAVAARLVESVQKFRQVIATSLEEEGVPLGAEYLRMIDEGVISTKIAKAVFEEMYKTGKDPERIVEEKGLVQVSDTGAIEAIIDEVLAKEAGQVAEYRSGKEKLFGFFVGQVMKASRGKANPALVNELLLKKLQG